MGPGSVFLLKRETGLREGGRSRQLQVPQWGAVKGPPSIRATAQAGGRGGSSLTQCAELNRLMITAGPKDRAGFMEQPVK